MATRQRRDVIPYALAYPYPQSAAAFQNQVSAIAAFDSTDDPRGNPRAFIKHVIDFLPR
jgi:hypothetical protein